MSRKKKLDDLMEAVTFAEAGETELAQEIASELFPDAAARRSERILAVSGTAGFSPALVEKSLGLAERLEYGLVALSVPPAIARLASRLRRGRGSRSRLSPDAFRARAAERGVPFIHVVRSGDPERAVVDVRRTFRRISFLLVERELTAKARFATVNIPIFYLDR